MTSPRQIAANRLNAKKSTGPTSKRGKGKSAQNALRHGLSSFRRDWQATKDFTREIAGVNGAAPDILHLAQRIAEANVDLVRIRKVRQHAFNSYLSSAVRQKKEMFDKLAELAKTLFLIDRYERRALSRRKFAIRDFDAASGEAR